MKREIFATMTWLSEHMSSPGSTRVCASVKATPIQRYVRAYAYSIVLSRSSWVCFTKARKTHSTIGSFVGGAPLVFELYRGGGGGARAPGAPPLPRFRRLCNSLKCPLSCTVYMYIYINMTDKSFGTHRVHWVNRHVNHM